MYLKEKRIGLGEDPLAWWRIHAEADPGLSHLARPYIASERLFSGAGLAYGEKQSRLSAERASKSLFLKYNLSLTVTTED